MKEHWTSHGENGDQIKDNGGTGVIILSSALKSARALLSKSHHLLFYLN